MKTLLSHKTMWFIAFLFEISLIGRCGAQTNQIVMPSGDRVTLKSAGVETNGFSAGITLRWTHGLGELPDISSGIGLKPSIATNNPPGQSKPPHDWFSPGFVYFASEKLMCGPMELRDAKGRQMPSLKPQVTLSNAYPLTLKFSALWGQRPGAGGLHRDKMPMPIFRETLNLPLFHLKDYFKVKEPGDYQLVIWPKIYKKSETNGDVLQRIDLPPITVNFKWSDDADRKN